MTVQGRKACSRRAEGEDLRSLDCREGKRPAFNLNHHHMAVSVKISIGEAAPGFYIVIHPHVCVQYIYIYVEIDR